ncbi:GNAT family N-acetyltransferase [Roseomonas terrae]|uniref:GNAT family N-acetyltransferase n=1 Tax=Neoroseomonas terrae TaxID=424799 RepID=A0ABS5EHX1_9PROT|nr:GNAT family N-acetyltransferase [Neoroseomonas terrae]MBR0650628.1 GNAT family N-acetyltransferase [Neoroseomonas terrae]
MTDAPTVRPARPEDYDAWLPLWLGYNAFYGREGATAPAEAITRVTWARFFDALEPMDCLVAEVDGRLVGLAHLIFHRNTILAGSTCYLQDLFAAPDLRGRGVGRALIEALYAHAKAKGAERVYWHTHETNATARLLYDRVATHAGFLLYSKALG